jgi:hypothetical protein
VRRVPVVVGVEALKAWEECCRVEGTTNRMSIPFPVKLTIGRSLAGND